MIGELAIWYLFLAGAGAGALMVGSVLEMRTPFNRRCTVVTGGMPVAGATSRGSMALWCCAIEPRPDYQGFFGPVYGVGLLAVLVGTLCLFADLGRPDRVLMLLLHPTFSFIAIGVYLLMFLMLCAGVLWVLWGLGLAFFPRWLAGLARGGCILGSVAVMAYTGLLLASMPAVIFWNTWWLPLLFVVSDISAGFGLVALSVVLSGDAASFHTTLTRMRHWDSTAVAAEAVLLLLLMLTALSKGPTAQVSVALLLSGALAPLFWGMVVGVGLLFPLVLERVQRAFGQRSMIVLGVALVISCFFLRWCVVQAGALPDIEAAIMTVLGSGP